MGLCGCCGRGLFALLYTHRGTRGAVGAPMGAPTHAPRTHRHVRAPAYLRTYAHTYVQTRKPVRVLAYGRTPVCVRMRSGARARTSPYIYYPHQKHYSPIFTKPQERMAMIRTPITKEPPLLTGVSLGNVLSLLGYWVRKKFLQI